VDRSADIAGVSGPAPTVRVVLGAQTSEFGGGWLEPGIQGHGNVFVGVVRIAPQNPKTPAKDYNNLVKFKFRMVRRSFSRF